MNVIPNSFNTPLLDYIRKTRTKGLKLPSQKFAGPEYLTTFVSGFYGKITREGSIAPLFIALIMISVAKIRELVEEKILGTELFITDINIRPVNKIHVALEKLNGGVMITDCVQVSRHIESNLDRSIEDYQLDVSSAGMEEPFKVRKQYVKNIGRSVEVITVNGERHEGKIVTAGDEEMEIEKSYRDKKSKKDITEIKRFNYQQIKQTKKIISFK